MSSTSNNNSQNGNQNSNSNNNNNNNNNSQNGNNNNNNTNNSQSGYNNNSRYRRNNNTYTSHENATTTKFEGTCREMYKTVIQAKDAGPGSTQWDPFKAALKGMAGRFDDDPADIKSAIENLTDPVIPI